MAAKFIDHTCGPCFFKTLVLRGLVPPEGGVPGIYFRVITPCGKHDLTKAYLDLHGAIATTVPTEFPDHPNLAKLDLDCRSNGTLYNPALGCAVITEAGGGCDIGLADMLDEVAMLIRAESWELQGYGSD